MLHPAVNVHPFCPFLYCPCFPEENKTLWVRKVTKGKKKEKAGPDEAQDVVKNGSERKPRKRLAERGSLREAIF